MLYTYAMSGTDLVITTQTGAGDRNGITDGTSLATTYNAAYQVISEVSTDLATGLPLTSRVADLSVTIHDIPGVSHTDDSNLVNGVDGMGRPVKWIYNGNPADYSISARGCCGPKYTRSRSGATSLSQRDGLRRVFSLTTQASSTDVPVTTTTSFTGLTTRIERSAGGTTLLVSEITKSLDGLSTTRLSPDADGDGAPETTTQVTTYPATGGRSTTVTYPDTTTSSSLTYRDGSRKSSTDQGGFTTTYDKGTHALQGGGLWSKMTPPVTTQFTQRYSDQLGRTFQTQFADGSLTAQTYHPFSAAPGSRGKLATTSDPDELAVAGSGSTASFSYNAEGERTITTTALSEGQSLVTTTDQDVIDDPDLGVSFRSRSWTNGILTSTSLRSSTGYQIKTTTLSGTSAATRSIPTDGAWTVTSLTPDGQSYLQTYSDGQLLKSEVFDNQGTAPANLITSNSYTYDDFGRTLSTVDARTGTTTIDGYLENGATVSVISNNGADTTSFTYDVMGRRLSTTLPDTSETYSSYTSRGQVLATWGSQTYAKLYQYDALGRMTELRTYQNLAHGTQPTIATPGFASTTWAYDPQRGWLTEKNYAGESVNGPGNAADYTYTLSGRLATRTWERGVITTYGYDQGQLATITYSAETNGHTTPNLSYRYDNFGRPSTVTQAGNIHTYTYDPAKLVLDTEEIAYDLDLDGTSDFTRTLDRQQDALLRPSALLLGETASLPASPEHSTAYTYDSAGRLHTVADGNDTFTYGYLAKSGNLVETLSGPAHTATKTYETHRSVLTNLANTAGATLQSNYAYTVNNLGQRTNLTTSGSAFTTAPVYTWQYNSRGELVQADDSSTADQDRAYQYDGIGNRQKTANGLLASLPASNNYAANPLNQYTTIPGLSGAPSYDLDGNATSYPVPASPGNNASLRWDAENRLVLATVAGTTTHYRYDYLSRRLSKQVGTAASQHYLYDGWNLLAEYTGATLKKRYTWGMDLSGSMQGAGGVGGLLSVHDGSATHYPTYDGNGNVSEYLDTAGSVAAHYEYDAFGNTTVATGPKKDDFSHRFSTKPLDAETGLYYYGYRYYDPKTGRWPSRDPIGEVGGPTWFEKFETVQAEILDLETLVQEISSYYNLNRYQIHLLESVLSALRIKIYQELYHPNLGVKHLLETLYGLCGNNPINFYDYLGLSGRGGKPKRNLDCEGFNLKSSVEDVAEALADAVKNGQKARAKALRALLKVIKRGGKLGGFIPWFLWQQIKGGEPPEPIICCDDDETGSANA